MYTVGITATVAYQPFSLRKDITQDGTMVTGMFTGTTALSMMLPGEKIPFVIVNPYTALGARYVAPCGELRTVEANAGTGLSTIRYTRELELMDVRVVQCMQPEVKVVSVGCLSAKVYNRLPQKVDAVRFSFTGYDRAGIAVYAYSESICVSSSCQKSLEGNETRTFQTWLPKAADVAVPLLGNYLVVAEGQLK